MLIDIETDQIIAWQGRCGIEAASEFSGTRMGFCFTPFTSAGCDADRISRMDSYDMAPLPGGWTRVEFLPHEVGPFATNKLLQQFTQRVKEYPSNDAVSGKLERLVCDLLRKELTPFFTIDEFRFPSAVISPWQENNYVYAYLYRRRRTETDDVSPTILIPSFIEGSPMTRAVSLLLVERGWTVLEVAMPFYGKRIVPQLAQHQTLSERYATLQLTPADFGQYLEQAVSDICEAAVWMSSLVEPRRIATLGFSFAASAALTACTKTSVMMYAVGLCPPIDWAHAIWTADDQRPYFEFLKFIKVTEEDFRRSVSPFQLDHEKPQKDRLQQAKIFILENDGYTVKSVIESLAERFGMLKPTCFGGSDHISGLWPHFNTIMESTVVLVTSKQTIV